MNRRDLVIFNADFFKDEQWDREGNLVSPGGYAIAVAIGAGLQLLNVDCSEFEIHSHYEWAFEASWGMVREWVLLTVDFVLRKDGWLIQIEKQTSLLGKILESTKSKCDESLRLMVHQSLIADIRFSEIRWRNRTDYEQGIDVAWQSGPKI